MQTVNRRTTLACAIAATFSFGCSRPERPLTVGGKNSTEQTILAEIVAQHLERKLQTRVQRQFNMGGTLMAHQALISAEIDVYPEYAGAALATVLKLGPIADADIAQERVKREYAALHLTWMPPLGFDRRFVLVAGGAVENARTLSEAAEHTPGWIIGVDHEFMDRPGGFAMLMKVYNLPLSGAPRILKPQSVYDALAAKQVSIAAANATDGMLGAGNFKVLRDDRQAFAPDRGSLVARTASLRRFPGMQEALERLAGRFPDETMVRLNHEVDGRKRPPAEVAREFLAQAGL
jgi:glycine betaine/choline ABC-type transport system substrate-binding protein